MLGSPAFGELADQGYHLALGRAFAEAWAAGEFPPKWSATANGGLGSPAFQLYPPLFPLLTAAWMRLIGESSQALCLATLTATVFNLFSIQWAARAWLPGWRAWAAAGLALLMPGVTFVGLGRGMFPNFLALGWAAIAGGAAQRRSFVVLAFAGAGLILTHTPTAYLTALAGLTLAAIRPKSLPGAAIAGIAALTATAWFWGPMLDVADHAQTSYLIESHPYSESLWLSASMASTAFQKDWRFLNQVATAFGVAQFTAASLLYLWTRSTGLAVLALWALAASIWPTGEWLTALPHYASVQFCWRWQPLLAVACAIASTALPWRRALCVTPLALFLPLAFPSSQAPGADPDLASNLIEMRPVGAGHELYPPGEPGRVEIIDGLCDSFAVEISPSRRVYRVEASTECTLRIYTYAFPGWRAAVNGKPAPIEREKGTALQLVRVPAGKSTLVLCYGCAHPCGRASVAGIAASEAPARVRAWARPEG